jgi:hypothetical protein
VLGALVFALAMATAFAAPARADSNLDEAQFFADLNAVRARAGVPPLATDGQLISVARAWSSQMAGGAGLSHNPSLGSQIGNWRSLGENVGEGSDVASIEAALEASPHHYQNMVDPNFQYVGVGVVEAGGTVWVTEDFKQSKSGVPSTAVPAPAPKPSPRPASPPTSGTGAAPARTSRSAPARTSAAAPAAVAAAHLPGSVASDASAPPAPSTAPSPGTEPAKSSTALPARLAVISAPRGLDAARVASLGLFAVIAAVVVLASHGRLRLPGRPARRASN